MEQRRREREARAEAGARTSFRRRVLVIGGGAMLVVGLLIGWNTGLFGGPAADHPYASFAQCLTDQKVTMYGTDWCPNCQNQKKMFGAAFKYIDYVNCDFNQQVCDAQGVEGYPTWKINGQLIGAGVQTFPTLGATAECKLPENL